MKFNLKEDMHIHSTFSDGTHSVAENIIQAETVGLTTISCVDHVRHSTDWLDGYVSAIENLRAKSNITVRIGVEAKILNEAGELDMPENTLGVEKYYAADHQIPLGDRCYTPKEIRMKIKDKELTNEDVIVSIVNATNNTLLNYKNVVIAHLFSVLPKIHLSENNVPISYIESIAINAKKTNAEIEVDERWKCPKIRTLNVFKNHGVSIVFSSDSHRKETIGKYEYNQEVFNLLNG